MSRPILWFLLAWLLLGTHSSYAQSNALSFDGSDDRVTSALPSVFTTIASSDITVEVWIKPQNPNGPQLQRLLFAQSNSSNFLSLAIGPNGSAYAYVNSGGTTSSVSSTAPLSAGQWTHLALTWQAATRTVQLYLNGSLATTTSGGISSSAMDNVLALGARTDGAQPYNGVLDELKIWSAVRTPAQIGTDQANAADPTEPDLVAYYNFDQGVANGSNPTVTRLGNQANPPLYGSLVNFALDGTASNWVPGRTAAPLPVEVVSFVATTRNGAAYLTWRTAMEKNNDRFILRKSTDAATFTPLATLPGAGTTATGRTYRYTDTAPAAGITYYRLEQVDTDGQVRILGVRSVAFSSLPVAVQAYPNPTTDWLYLTVPPQVFEQVRLLDAHGKVHRTMSLTGSFSPTLDLTGLPAGTYLLTLQGPGQMLTKKVVKR